MARLTEQEITLIQRARQGVDSEATDIDSALSEGRRLRATAMVRMIAHGVDVGIRVTGLKLLSHLIVRPIRIAMKHYATMEQLKRLDDRMLEDIGLDRGMIYGYASDLSSSEPARPRLSLIERFRRWREMRATIRQLQALDDHLLADIGLLRSEISKVVKDAMGADPAAQGGQTTIKDLIEQIDLSATGSYRRSTLRQVSRRIAKLEGTEAPKINYFEVRA